MINQGRTVLYGTVRDIRRQHADHAVVVRTEDRLGDIPGVRSVESINGDHKLTLEADTTPEAVLRALLDRHVRIESYALASLPLEDIFVKVVRQGAGPESPEPPAGHSPGAR